MKRQFGLVFLVLGMACANAHAQNAPADAAANDRNVAAEYSPLPAAGSALFQTAGGSTYRIRSGIPGDTSSISVELSKANQEWVIASKRALTLRGAATLCDTTRSPTCCMRR